MYQALDEHIIKETKMGWTFVGPAKRQPEKTANIWRSYQWFPRQMTSEKQVQKFHTDDVSLPRSGYCFWLVVPHGKFDWNNQKHYPDLSSDASSVWNFCACFLKVIWWGNQLYSRQMSAVFSGWPRQLDKGGHFLRGLIKFTLLSSTTSFEDLDYWTQHSS